jgi:hypothetical protein
VFAAQHLLGLRGFDLRLERHERLLEIGRDILAALRPLEQHADVADLVRKAVAQLDVFGEPALALQGLLRLGLVVPEIRRRDFLFELG